MKKIFLLLFSLLVSLTGVCQSQAYSWAAVDTIVSQGEAIATDNEGNVYVLIFLS